MAPTRTVKNKHAAPKGGGSSGGKGPRKSSDGGGISKGKSGPKAKVPATQIKGRPNLAGLDKNKKKKQRVYTEKELGIPELNMITPVGVTKPKGKKKGKVFVDDKESMTTILALVQADKDGQIESKMMRARQMEEIREARRAEADKKEAERSAKLEDTKESLRRKRKRATTTTKGGPGGADDEVENIKAVAATGTKAAKAKKKRVSFAAE
ncbi:60S ribosomal subunit assembly/export protein loc-1 [Chaetomium fimeti]|uniref:60S ribosomal subunit assembly/export protein loc-1 n=1 Tax=Chaetomium fimeti TaxID=1854472 RepID=A0AAE0HM98_9PEZI|nr:60S ribosomal subunit assembly/export protein loc-1 [Chaetomium fimeti]